MHSNLITTRGYWTAHGWRLFRRGLWPLALVLVAAAVTVGVELRALSSLGTRREAWQHAAEQVDQLKQKVRRLHRQREELARKVAAVGNVGRGLPPAWLLAVLGRAVDAAQSNVALDEVQFSEGADGPSYYAVNLRGRAVTHADVASFVGRLRMEEPIRDVEIRGVRSDPDEQHVQFDVSFAVGKKHGEGS